MKLIYPNKFKMNRKHLDCDVDYRFGVWGSVFNENKIIESSPDFERFRANKDLHPFLHPLYESRDGFR